MNVFFLISLKARLSDLKKINAIIRDLIELKFRIYFIDIACNQRIEKYLLRYKYNNYVKLKDNKGIEYYFKECFSNKIDKIIILGMAYNDIYTKYLDIIIGSNIDIYIVISEYGVLSDATKLIHEGAYIMNSKYDLIT